MTTLTQDKKITKAEIKTALKSLLPFTVQKIGENVTEAILTLVFASLTIAYIAAAINPLLAQSYSGFIITIFVLILLRRVVQDFDDSTTVEELSERLLVTEERIAEIHRMAKAETSLPDDELDSRLQS